MIHSTLLLRLAAVIKYGSMRQAALRLNISQPALSQSIRELEEIVGAPLFDRTARGLTVTAAGQRLGIHADIVAHEIQKTAATVATLHSGQQGHYAIGGAASICSSALPRAADTLLDEALVSGLSIFEGIADPMVERLSRGALDVVVTYLWNSGCANPDLSYATVGVSEISVVAERTTAEAVLAAGPQALSQHRWVVMSKNPELRQRFENFFLARASAHPVAVIETDSLGFALGLMQERRALAFMPLGHAGILDHRRFVTIEIEGITWSRGVGVFYRNRAHQPPALARLIGLLGAYYADAGNRGLANLKLA